MRVSTFTHLTLLEWGNIMGINPWDLAQIGEGFPVSNTAQCAHVWFQQSWQQDFLSREELAFTISKAEEAVAEELGYWPAQRYFLNEEITYPQGYGEYIDYSWKSIRLGWKKIQAVGMQDRTYLVDAAVVLSDKDGDGVNDTFTATFATTLTDTSEIGIYFKAADRNNEPIDETWRIRPVDVAISGGVATVKGFIGLVVVPDLTTIVNPVSLNITTATNFVTQVEAYRVFTSQTVTTLASQQGYAIWENEPCDVLPCSGTALPICAGIRNADQGYVWADYGIGIINPIFTTSEPDRVFLNYLAGVPYINGRMQREYADIVAHLAVAWLPVGSCGCERSDRILSYWRQYPSELNPRRPISKNELEDNPFGIERGAIYAYKRIQMLRAPGAVNV